MNVLDHKVTPVHNLRSPYFTSVLNLALALAAEVPLQGYVLICTAPGWRRQYGDTEMSRILLAG